MSQQGEGEGGRVRKGGGGRKGGAPRRGHVKSLTMVRNLHKLNAQVATAVSEPRSALAPAGLTFG